MNYDLVWLPHNSSFNYEIVTVCRKWFRQTDSGIAHKLCCLGPRKGPTISESAFFIGLVPSTNYPITNGAPSQNLINFSKNPIESSLNSTASGTFLPSSNSSYQKALSNS